MPAQRITLFQGEAPRLNPRLLGESQARAAVNLRLTSGRIDPVYYPLEVGATLNTGTLKTIYRMFDSSDTDYWLNWTADVDVVKGPIAGDETFRLYFTSDEFEPRVTNLTLATSLAPYPSSWYVLGVTPPVTAPSCSPSGGSGTQESRAWVYTFVTPWGEESAPSPASSITTTYINATWSLTIPDTAPSNTYTTSAASWSAGTLTVTVGSTFGLREGEYITLSGLAPASLNTTWRVASVTDSTHFTITMSDPGSITDPNGTATRVAPHNTSGMTKRIYRSVTTSLGTEYYFIKEISAATTSTDDDVTEVGEALSTTEWAMPPVDLRGLMALPSGALVGFAGNRVCFSEPLAPYAWPESYQLTTEHAIVGIGVFGTSIVVVTKGYPYIAAGVDPASITMSKIDQHWPGLAKRGIVSVTGGVVWPTSNGLVLVSDAGPQLVTDPFYSRVEWQRLNPSTFIGAFFDNRYYAGYTDSNGDSGMFIYDSTGQMTYKSSLEVTAMFTDPPTGKLYFVHEDLIKEWDANVFSRLPFEWWSRDFVVATPVNLGAARIEADFTSSSAEVDAHDAAVLAQETLNQGYITANTNRGSSNGWSINAYSVNGSRVIATELIGDGATRSVTLELYAGNEVVASKAVTSTRTFRLPAGRKYDVFSVRLLGNVPVDAVVIGDTADALREA